MTWEREPGVAEIVATCVAFISERPRLASLLYDLDMRTEQLAGLCEVYRELETAEIRFKQAEELLRRSLPETLPQASADEIRDFLRESKDAS